MKMVKTSLPTSSLRGHRRVAREARQSRVGVKVTDTAQLLPPPDQLRFGASPKVASRASPQGGGSPVITGAAP